mmetsp:Transcript_20223/g.30008  ORF Transcript_20223/g.30008 Transcript_20223/m.30008 type:complete len:102 (-) Transcript_20223:256-561(-)
MADATDPTGVVQPLVHLSIQIRPRELLSEVAAQLEYHFDDVNTAAGTMDGEFTEPPWDDSSQPTAFFDAEPEMRETTHRVVQLAIGRRLSDTRTVTTRGVL